MNVGFVSQEDVDIGASNLRDVVSTFSLLSINRTQRATGLRFLVIIAGVLMYFFVGKADAAHQLYSFKMVHQDNVMLHFDLDAAAATAELFTLQKPHRLVIDFPGAVLSTALPDEVLNQGVIKTIRHAQHGDNFLRVVLDLRRAIEPSSRLVPRRGGQRLVVDLGVKAGREQISAAHTVVEQRPLRDAIIAIDAGHGGKDPGALGANETREKDITLSIALKLHDSLASRAGITPVLIRDDDYYVELRRRIEIASEKNADVFVSIHADAVNHDAAHGSSVYALSMDGATSEAAAWLAKSENESAALYGDVSLHGLDDTLRQTLLDLTQNNTMERSLEAGAAVLEELGKVGSVHKESVEQAGFAVLRSPDIPSILIETAFISNRAEERRLNDPAYQKRVAEAIEAGLLSYLRHRAPEGTHLAAERRRDGS
ncbi:MAG: N-acetylmuramoyl-L-alanine amidase [Granulosicoccus sp.]|nr:N-acetylmuramoyl-L-alanine amidase [Granulosicoccus sp.]